MEGVSRREPGTVLLCLLFRDRLAGYGEVGEEHQKRNSNDSSQAAVTMSIPRSERERY